eukprot:4480190-Amphidinium_carterae.1
MCRVSCIARVPQRDGRVLRTGKKISKVVEGNGPLASSRGNTRCKGDRASPQTTGVLYSSVAAHSEFLTDCCPDPCKVLEGLVLNSMF